MPPTLVVATNPPTQPPLPRIFRKADAPGPAACATDPSVTRDKCTCCPFPVVPAPPPPPPPAPIEGPAEPSRSTPTVNPLPSKRKARPAQKGKGKAREGEAYGMAQIAELDQLTTDQQQCCVIT
jgi:hypothetical protein